MHAASAGASLLKENCTGPGPHDLSVTPWDRIGAPPKNKKTTKSAVLFVRWALLNALKTAVRKIASKWNLHYSSFLLAYLSLMAECLTRNACFSWKSNSSRLFHDFDPLSRTPPIQRAIREFRAPSEAFVIFVTFDPSGRPLEKVKRRDERTLTQKKPKWSTRGVKIKPYFLKIQKKSPGRRPQGV